MTAGTQKSVCNPADKLIGLTIERISPGGEDNGLASRIRDVEEEQVSHEGLDLASKTPVRLHHADVLQQCI